MHRHSTVALSLLAINWVVAVVSGDPGDTCYRHYDHASQYKLDYVASSYPWDEVEKAMGQNPMLSELLAQGTKVPTGRPPNSGTYYQPISVVCPSQRFMLKAFEVDGKECYVIKPEVQQVRYSTCSGDNRDCRYCSYIQGKVSKCEEDYEWQFVWAYCKPLQPAHPAPVRYAPPQPKPAPPQPQPQPHPQPYPPVRQVHPQPPYKPYPEPPVQYPVQQPQQEVYVTDKLYAARPRYHDPYPPGHHNVYPPPPNIWKRSVPAPLPGNVEKISLYIPFQCSCKNFQC